MEEKDYCCTCNGTHWKKLSAVMVTVNTVQILDALMIVANAGRV